MKFSSKAKNLIELKKLNLKKSDIPTFYKYKIEEIKKNKKKILNFLIKNLSKKICIRSSYFLEDNKNKSMAGEFEGVTNVINSKKNLILGINKLVKQLFILLKIKRSSHKFLYSRWLRLLCNKL